MISYSSAISALSELDDVRAPQWALQIWEEMEAGLESMEAAFFWEPQPLWKKTWKFHLKKKHDKQVDKHG